MFTVANTFNTNDYYTDNNSVICTITYNDYGTTGYDAWAEYNRRTQEVKRSFNFFLGSRFFLEPFLQINEPEKCHIFSVAYEWL